MTKLQVPTTKSCERNSAISTVKIRDDASNRLVS